MNDKSRVIGGTPLKHWASATASRYRWLGTEIDPPCLVPSRYNILVTLKTGAALLFNAYSRAMCRLDPGETARYRAWENSGRADTTEDRVFAQSLATDGYLVPIGTDELAAVRKDYFAARHDERSMVLTVAPTMACNLACGYCFQGLNKDLRKLDPRVPDAIIHLVDHHKERLQSLNVSWYGGEPLMAKNAIFDLADRLIALCDMNGIDYSSMIVTNGFFLTPDIARQLYSRRCTTAQVTVDGLQATHDRMRPLTSGRGSFETLMRNIAAVVKETPLRISLRVNVGRENLGECEALLDTFVAGELERNGTFSVYFAPIDAGTPESGTAWEEGLTKREFNASLIALGERARQLGFAGPVQAPSGFMGMCVAAKENGYVITHTGDMHKCWETAHDPRKRIGTVFEPEKIKASRNAALWQAWSPFDSDVCKACKILPMCGGFCGHRFLYNGAGNDEALPCPDWKWNTAEYLFARAKSLGVASNDEWLPDEATVTARQSGERHTPESLRQAQASVLNAVSQDRGERVNRDFLLHGDGRLFEETPLKGRVPGTG